VSLPFEELSQFFASFLSYLTKAGLTISRKN